MLRNSTKRDIQKGMDLLSISTSSGQKKFALAIACLSLIICFAVLPFSTYQLGEVKPFFPMFITWVFLGDLMTAYLLYNQFRVTGSKSILILSGTFLFTGLITIPQILTFPGVFSATGLLGAGNQTAVWFWVCWHGGFPLGILCYVFFYKFKKTSVKQKFYYSTVLIGSVVAVILLITILLTQFHDKIPAIIKQGDYHSLVTSGVGPAVWVLNLLALLCLVVIIRTKSLLHMWLAISVLSFFIDVTVTMFAGSRFSLGWYAARLNSLTSSTVVLLVFFNEINRLYVRVMDSQKKLTESQARTETILESITDAFFALDKEYRYTYQNKKAEKFSGKTSELLMGKVFWEEFPFFKETKLFQACEEARKTKREQMCTDYSLVSKCWYDFHIYPSKEGISVYYHDVTFRKQAEERLQEANHMLQEANTILMDASFKDGLTGVFNRRYFDQKLNEEWEKSMAFHTPVSLIMLDIDYFKKYNDTYGHQAGDECLKAIARAAKRYLQTTPGFLTRYGGEEFAVILPGMNSKEAIREAELIRKLILSLAIEHKASPILPTVSASFGTATIDSAQNMDIETLIHNADQALYKAKTYGRNCVKGTDLSLHI